MMPNAVNLKKAFDMDGLPFLERMKISLGSAALSSGSPPHRSKDATVMLSLLWHKQSVVRYSASLALSGGDGDNFYSPRYGNFAASLLRHLHGSDRSYSDSIEEQRARVETALQNLLEQVSSDIRGMGNMHYSFLGGSLYLALLGTCRDAVESVRRLQLSSAHEGLCSILWTLYQRNVARRLDHKDLEYLVQSIGYALSTLPPGEIEVYWNGLSYAEHARRRALIKVLPWLESPQSLPYILKALPDQPVYVSLQIIASLGRLGDIRAMPALIALSENKSRQIRQGAQISVSHILKANRVGPAATLLRPAFDDNDGDKSLLRPPIANHHNMQDLLRILPEDCDA